uniref:DM13 domain-containing protein n=1 Tax=Caenorhabditis tropicalis TaxID=1561998 RepID=A0A1I7V3P3_9PELO
MTGSAAQWKQLAVVNPNGDTLSFVNLNLKPPQPFCCFESESDLGLFGEHGIVSDPIEVIDSRTLRIPKFSFKASQTSDSYFFAGAGTEINKNSGIKAFIIGRDSTPDSCPMRKDLTDQTMTVRLDQSQTIYDIEWISVFSYKNSHDFGHLDIGLVENEEQVPPFIPDVRTSEPPRSARNC